MILVVDGTFLSISAADWAEFLANLALKSLLVLAAAYAMTPLFGRWPAALRSRIWTLVFCVLLGLPLISALSPRVKLAGLTTPFVCVIQGDATTGANLESGAAAPTTNSDGVETPFTTAPGNASTATKPWLSVVSSQFVFQHWILVIVLWLFGAVLFAGQTARRFYLGLSAARSARPVTSRVFDSVKKNFAPRRPVELRLSETVTAPFVTGMKRQYIVLPAVLTNWDESDLRAVFQHELAHVRRQDLLRLIFYDLVCGLYWFNPLARMAARRAALDAEMACDDIVCGKEGPAFSYARRLLWFARQASDAREPAPTPGMSGTSGVERRIKYLLDPRTHSPGRSATARKAAAVVTAALVVLVSLGAATLQIVATNRPTPVLAGDSAVASLDQLNPESTARPAAGGDLPRDMFTASVNGDVETVRNILDRNPGYLNAQTKRGMTPLALAAWNGHLNVVDYLIARGANPDVKNHNGLTPLFCAVDRGRAALARLLIRGDADLTTRGFRGRTLLHMAARSGDADLVRILVERGAGINATDVRGVTPLDLARRHGKQSIASFLSRHGAVHSTSPPPAFSDVKRSKSSA